MRFVVITLAMYALCVAVLMGVGVTGVLAAGMVGARPILIAVAAGVVLAIPVTWIVTRQILAKTSKG